MKYIGLIFIILWTLISCNIGNKILEASFEVDGMSIRGGFLWLGWPTDIGKALEGLVGIENHTFNTEKRLFSVVYNPKRTDKEKIISRVESAGSFTVKNWIELK